MAEVSIIVPVYNVEEYLKRCVDSILTQTFTDFELILVDDGSTDKSGKICDEYAKKDSRVVVIHKENGGVSKARNCGIDAAKGQYIMFCDSDDWVKSDWIMQLYSEIKTKGFDFVSSNVEMTDKNKNVLNRTKFSAIKGALSNKSENFEFIEKQILCHGIVWSACDKIFRRDIIKNNKIFFCVNCENFAEDICFVIEYALLCQSYSNINYSGYCYFQREDSMMHITENDIKLNAVNEVSKHFWEFAEKIVDIKLLKKHFPIINALIMGNQYAELLDTDLICLPEEISKIEDKSFFKKNILKSFFKRRELKSFFGYNDAKRILIYYKYCLHKSYKLYGLESGFFYKFCYKK